MTWTQPLCGECWSAIDRREPVRIKDEYAETETCCMCGHQTRSGIYRRMNPKTVRFPRVEEET